MTPAIAHILSRRAGGALVVAWAVVATRADERVVHHIRGVRAIQNYVTVAPLAVTKDVRHRIVEALHRNASVDAQHILVTVTDDTAMLGGTVGSLPQREAAEEAAAHAPGFARVDNRIVVEPREPVDEQC